jgi:hypothetical protein
MRMFRAFNEPGAAPLVWRRGGPTTQLMTTCDAGVFDMAPRRAPLLVDVGRGTGLVLCAGYTVALELQFGMRCYRGADAPPPPYKIASTWFDLCPDTGAVYDGHLPVRSIELDLHCGIVVATYDAGATETVTESALHCRIMTVTETRSETRRAKVQRLDKAIVCAPDIVLLAGRIDMPNGTTHSTMCIDAASGTVLVAGDSAPATFVAIGGA